MIKAYRTDDSNLTSSLSRTIYTFDQINFFVKVKKRTRKCVPPLILPIIRRILPDVKTLEILASKTLAG